MIPKKSVRVYLALGSTDLRKAVNGLSVLVEQAMGLDPFCGDLFVFCNRRQNIIKILYWDDNGFALWYKRLEEQLRLLRDELFGRRSEKHHGPHPDQRLLFDDKDAHGLSEAPPGDDKIPIVAHSRKKRGRKPLPADLPRIDIIHDLREDQKQCACGAELTCFGIDESPLQVLNEAGRKNTSTSYMWVFRGGSPDRPVLIYEYQRSRSGKTALAFLHDYKGYIQTDDFSGYDHLDQKPGVVHLGCWAHARRKFVKVAAVRKKHRAKRINPKSLAEQALDYIGKLYGIEKQARRQELDADQIRRLRPGNNLVENAIRPFVVGRKELAICRQPRWGQGQCHHLYTDRNRQGQWHRPLCLPEIYF
jgi:hypothetical protein